ncbi:MAG: AAA family ATPase [Alphaproteobacteria bacterium]|nr:AAA family ATPase [Alphaproteobacteria bacterium]
MQTSAAIIKILFWSLILYLTFKPKKKTKGETLLQNKTTAKSTTSSERSVSKPLATYITEPTSQISINKHPIIDEPVKKASTKLSKLQQDTFEIIENTNKNIFIQGQAGTGKSTFVDYLQSHSNKRILVACPTAVAAINVGGSTLHSLFKLPLSDFLIIDEIIKKPRRTLASILQKTDLLIIDEVSMVRPDMLDAIDALSRIARCNRKVPFGGLQILLIGDLCQLPPVIKKNTYTVFKQEYGISAPYFFDAKSYKNGNFDKIEFSRVYRQSDTELLNNLIKLRNYEDLDSVIEYFNNCKITDKNILDTAVTITPYRAVAEQMNKQRLEAIKGTEKNYECKTTGTFDEVKDSPAPRVLTLRKGALVIFNKNNGSKWINGTSGIVESLSDNIIEVRILKTNEIVAVKREEWKIYQYDIDKETSKVYEKEVGSFIQFPLQLGYALTIHKAQGKTLDSVIIDIDRGAFAHGQLYVALSRTRKKSDIHLVKPISLYDIIQDDHVINFLKEIQ